LQYTFNHLLNHSIESQTSMEYEVDIKKDKETSFLPKATGNGEDGGWRQWFGWHFRKGDLVCEDDNYNVMFKVYIYIL